MDAFLFGMLLIPGLFMLMHLTALILALVYHRRCPAACRLVILASVLNLVATPGVFVGQMISVHGEGAIRMQLMIVFVFAFISWIAYGLLLVAVFAGRNQRAPQRSRHDPLGEDDDWDRPVAAPKPRAVTGIQERKL
jgi:uncharacterized protein with PQ loop repeat